MIFNAINRQRKEKTVRLIIRTVDNWLCMAAFSRCRSVIFMIPAFSAVWMNEAPDASSGVT